eukprot:6567075-Pyramimonas_sp.AAC.1
MSVWSPTCGARAGPFGSGTPNREGPSPRTESDRKEGGGEGQMSAKEVRRELIRMESLVASSSGMEMAVE